MRIAIFCFFGPPLGAIFMFGLAVPSGGVSVLLSGLFYSLLFSYLPGFAPAILTAQADDYLSDKLTLWPRVAVISLVGTVVTVAWLSLISGLATEWTWGAGLGWGFVGAIAAAVCSWLSGKWERDDAERGRLVESGREHSQL